MLDQAFCSSQVIGWESSVQNDRWCWMGHETVLDVR